jgi:hypothetical protein
MDKKVLELKVPSSKSGFHILECLRRMLKLARQRQIKSVSIVFVGADNKVHIDRVIPNEVNDRDRLLDAIEQMHEHIIDTIEGGDSSA